MTDNGTWCILPRVEGRWVWGWRGVSAVIYCGRFRVSVSIVLQVCKFESVLRLSQRNTTVQFGNGFLNTKIAKENKREGFLFDELVHVI